MTDAERSELEMLEGRAMRRALTEFEKNRLNYLRLRAQGVMTWREVLDIYAEVWPPSDMERESPFVQRMAREQRELEAAVERMPPLELKPQGWAGYEVHGVMLPPPAEDDGELE